MEPKTPPPQKDDDTQSSETEQQIANAPGASAPQTGLSASNETVDESDVTFRPNAEGEPTIADEDTSGKPSELPDDLTKPGAPKNGDTELDPTLATALPADEPSISDAEDTSSDPDKPAGSAIGDGTAAGTSKNFSSDTVPPAPPAAAPESSADNTVPATGVISPNADTNNDTQPAAIAGASLGAGVASRGRRKKLGLLAVIVAILVVLLGASAAAYFGYIVPNKPENIMKQALANTFLDENLKSMTAAGEFDVSGKESSQNVNGTFTMYSSMDGKLDFKTEIDATVTKINAELRSLDGKNLYVKVSGLEGLPELLSSSGSSTALYAPLVTSINNQWFEISQSLLESTLGAPFDFSSPLTKEDAHKIAEAYNKHPFVIIKETLPSQKIDNTDTHHYRIGFDNAKLRSFLDELNKAKIKNFTFSAEELNQIKKTDLSKADAEVWIGKNDERLKQISFKMTEGDTTTNMRVTITKFNEERQVEKPAGAKSIMELLGGLMSSSQLTGLESGITL